ncbi:Dynein light chain 2 cytoplasmic [Taenia crassiceps]|uniref:Dynein light chain n=1 Tax=Taenia crassiceps TaxID=6207 RepID=A0ABR4QN49_9CEST
MAFGDVRQHRTGSSGIKRSPTRVLIQVTDMSEELQLLAVNTASDALESCRKPKDIAGFIKKAFDEQLYPEWMCVVGQAFGRCDLTPSQDMILQAMTKAYLPSVIPFCEVKRHCVKLQVAEEQKEPNCSGQQGCESVLQASPPDSVAKVLRGGV